MSSITPYLWFDNQAREAAAFFVSVFKNSKITSDAGQIVTFELDGQPFIALNGGDTFKFNEAISMHVSCQTQQEVDDLWDKLCEGGEPGSCGWLKDRYGLSWQIIPSVLSELLSGPDRDRADRVMRAMLGMKKMDIKALQEA
jgi:predicted 3-demethylubiquinone-9 3-methyltransferase (glyoxalase superfamily)